MQTYEIKFKIPHEVFITLHKPLEEVGEDIRKQAAIRYYKKRTLSLGKAAGLAGMTRFEFIEYLKHNKESVFSYTDQELDEIEKDSAKVHKVLNE